jgi:hypothetical protein
MGHPDDVAVGLLGLAMAAVAFLGILAFTVIACAKAHRLLPERRSRAVYWIGMAVMVPLCLVTFPIAPLVMQALAVIGEFGWDAYAGGLRVVDKHGLLSDGQFLSVFWTAAMGIGCIVLDFWWVIPITVWHCHFNPRRQSGKRGSTDAVSPESEAVEQGAGPDRRGG